MLKHADSTTPSHPRCVSIVPSNVNVVVMVSFIALAQRVDVPTDQTVSMSITRHTTHTEREMFETQQWGEAHHSASCTHCDTCVLSLVVLAHLEAAALSTRGGG